MKEKKWKNISEMEEFDEDVSLRGFERVKKKLMQIKEFPLSPCLLFVLMQTVMFSY